MADELKQPTHIKRHFAYEHLPSGLKKVSAAIGEVARELDEYIPHCAEKTAGLRKLLEAKDCFVRAQIEAKGAK